MQCMFGTVGLHALVISKFSRKCYVAAADGIICNGIQYVHVYIYIYKASIYLASPNCNFPAPYSFILLQEIGAP